MKEKYLSPELDVITDLIDVIVTSNPADPADPAGNDLDWNLDYNN